MNHGVITGARHIAAACLIMLVTGVHVASAHHATIDRQPFMPFELPLIDGSRFVRSTTFKGRVTIINYWRSDCAACLLESGTLNQLAHALSEVGFIGVAIDDRIAAMRFLSRSASVYPQVYAPLSQGQLLQHAGNHRNVLPYTVILDAQQQICTSKFGLIDQDWILNAIRACGQ